MTNQLEGKVAAITGAASGIGLACTKTLLGLGATVVLVDRAEDRLNQLCAELGPKAIPVVVDLLDPKSVANMMPQILAKAGGLDPALPVNLHQIQVAQQTGSHHMNVFRVKTIVNLDPKNGTVEANWVKEALRSSRSR